MKRGILAADSLNSARRTPLLRFQWLSAVVVFFVTAFQPAMAAGEKSSSSVVLWDEPEEELSFFYGITGSRHQEPLEISQMERTKVHEVKELYDCQADPDEMRNLSGEGEPTEIAVKLAGILDKGKGWQGTKPPGRNEDILRSPFGVLSEPYNFAPDTLKIPERRT